MGRQGDFVVNYDVKLQQLESDVNKATKILRQHANQVNTTRLVGPQLSKDQLEQTKTMTDRQRGLNDAERLLSRTQSRRSGIIRRLIGGNKELTQVYDGLTLSLRRMALFWASAALVFGAVRLGKSVLELASQYQLVVRELTILGNEGEQVYSRLAGSAFDAASATGRTFTEAADAMKAWVRQGFAANEVADLTRTTLIGLNLTELSSIQLVRTLTAQMKAFNIPASDSISIIDKLLGVSRRYAIETSQLATGLRRFASSAAIANVTLDQQIGVMTAMMVRTQQSAQMVGRAGRTIFTRMRRNAVEALETIAKVQVFTDSARQSFRSLWDILGDTAANWQKMTEAERDQLAFQAAGLRQREFFLALMADFNIAQEANIESLSSVGLAYKANALLVTTLSKSIVGLQTAWASLLSQQSGVLAFASAIVAGLRSLLEISVELPEALIAIGAALPALTIVGVALTTAWNPGLVATLIAAASAITLLVFALGKIRGADQGSIVQESKELSNVMLQQAINARKLAGEFIKLRDAENASVDNTALLIKTRDGLNKLYPDLLQGEEDLDEIYNTLQDSLGNLTRRTVELSEARKELLRLEAKQQEQTALGTILEQRVHVPSGFQGALLADPEDASASLAEIGQALRVAQAQSADLFSQQLAHISVIRRLQLIMRKDAEDRNDIENRLVETYAREAQALKAVQLPTSLATAGLSEEGVVQNLLIRRGKEIETAKENVRWLLSLQQAYILVRSAREKLTAIDAPFVPETQGPVGEGTIEADPAVRKAIKATLDDLAQRLTIQRKIDQIASQTLKPMNDQVILEQEILDAKIAYLKEQIATEKNAVKLLHLKEALFKIDVGSVTWMKAYVNLLDSTLDISARSVTEAEKAERVRLRALTKEQRETTRLAKVTREITDAEADAINQKAANAIKANFGQVASLLFLRDIADENFRTAKQNAEDLAEAGAPTADRTAALRIQADGFNKLLQLNAQLQKAEDDAAKRVIDNSDRRLEIDQQRAVRTAALLVGNVTAAELGLRHALANLETAKNRTGELGKQGAIEARGLDVDRARADLAFARTQLEKKASEARVDLADALRDIDVERTRSAEGELAAAITVLGFRERILALAKSDTTDEGKIKILEAEIEVAKAQQNVDEIGNKAREKFQKDFNKLVAEGAQIELENIVAVTALREGKIAGIEKELELLDLAAAAAATITDEQERQLALKEVSNQRRKVEGELTRAEISAQQQLTDQLIQFAGQQLQAAIGGDFSASGAIPGVAGLIGTAIGGPLAGTIATAAGGILATLFQDPAEDLSDSLDTNTQAIDRNTQTLQDVFEQRIGVPTSFALPAAIARQGSLQGGVAGGVVQNISNITIPIDGRGQDATQIANEVSTILTKQLNIDSRRGFGTNVFAFG